MSAKTDFATSDVLTAAQMNALGTEINTKSVVSVSATGTATDEIEYITVNGAEKKIKSGSSGDLFVVKYNDYSETADKTYAEILAAYGAGKNIVLFGAILSSYHPFFQPGIYDSENNTFEFQTVHVDKDTDDIGNVQICTLTVNSSDVWTLDLYTNSLAPDYSEATNGQVLTISSDEPSWTTPSNPASTFVVSDCNDLTSSSGLTKAYQFTPGQTWADWVDSAYNTDNWYIDSDTMVAISDFQSQGARRVHKILGSSTGTGDNQIIVPSVYELYAGGPQ